MQRWTNDNNKQSSVCKEAIVESTTNFNDGFVEGYNKFVIWNDDMYMWNMIDPMSSSAPHHADILKELMAEEDPSFWATGTVLVNEHGTLARFTSSDEQIPQKLIEAVGSMPGKKIFSNWSSGEKYQMYDYGNIEKMASLSKEAAEESKNVKFIVSPDGRYWEWPYEADYHHNDALRDVAYYEEKDLDLDDGSGGNEFHYRDEFMAEGWVIGETDGKSVSYITHAIFTPEQEKNLEELMSEVQPEFVMVEDQNGTRNYDQKQASMHKEGSVTIDEVVSNYLEVNLEFLEDWVDPPDNSEWSDFIVEDLSDANLSLRLCDIVSHNFAMFCENFGLSAMVKTSEGIPYYLGNVQVSQNIPSDHSWVEIEDESGKYIVDFTASQFGNHPFPLVIRESDKDQKQASVSKEASGYSKFIFTLYPSGEYDIGEFLEGHEEATMDLEGWFMGWVEDGEFHILPYEETHQSFTPDQVKAVKEIIQLAQQGEDLHSATLSVEGYDFKDDEFTGTVEEFLQWLDNEAKIASILSPVRESLDENIWDGDRLKPEVSEFCLGVVEDYLKNFMAEEEIPVHLRRVILIGSITGYQYDEDADLDVNILIDLDTLSDNLGLEKELLIYEMRHKIGKINGELYPGTSHPVNLFLSTEEGYPPADGIYDMITDEWIKKPGHPGNIDPYANLKDALDRAEEIAEKVDAKWGAAQRTKAEIDRYPQSKPQIIRQYIRYLRSLNRILENVANERREIFDLARKQEIDPPQTSVPNVVYKYLEFNGLLDHLHEAAKTLKRYEETKSFDEPETDIASKAPVSLTDSLRDENKGTPHPIGKEALKTDSHESSEEFLHPFIFIVDTEGNLTYGSREDVGNKYHQDLRRKVIENNTKWSLINDLYYDAMDGDPEAVDLTENIKSWGRGNFEYVDGPDGPKPSAFIFSFNEVPGIYATPEQKKSIYEAFKNIPEETDISAGWTEDDEVYGTKKDLMAWLTS